MSDFVAHIVAQLDASKAEAQLQALTKKRVVDIEFNITNDLNSAFQKQFGGSGGSGNFSKLGQQAGQTYAKGFYRGYFKDQKWVADQAKVLEKQFPKARENAQASSFYKNAVKARDKEIARQQREEERQLAEGRKAADQQYKYLNNRELSYQKQRAKYIEQGRKQEQAVIRQNQQQVENYARRYGNGKYEADFAVMQSQLEKYGNQSTPGMEKANEALEKYKTTLSQIKQHFDPNEVFQFDKDSDLVNAFDDLDNAAERYKNAMREVGVETTKTLKPGQNIQKSNSILEYYNNNSKAIKKYGAELKQLAMEAQNATTVGELDDINQRFNTLKSTISAEGLTGRSIFSEIGRGFKQIAQFVGTYGLIQQIPQTIMKMAGETIKVDSAITELRKVSDASDAELANSFTKATAAAKEYGVAISDVITSTADWKRLGYTLNEAEELAKATTLLQRVGDNMTQESASQALVSTMQGFQLDASKAESIVNKFNEVANNYAIDTAGIGEALQRSAASFNFANTDLDEAIALIAGTNEATQNPTKVGNMWKTVSLRMRAAKQELEEMGEDTEGMIESTSQLRDYVMTLTGFDIMKSETEFKSLYEMIVGIGKEMDKLSDIDRTAFLEKLAGKNQANMLAATLQNWRHVQEAYETSLGADEVGGVGSAVKELENYQKGVEYSIGQFKAAFQELSVTTITSDFLKEIIDAGTKAIEVLTKLISIFGNLKSVVAGFTAFKLGRTFLKGFDQFKMLGDVANALKRGSDLSGISDIVRTAGSLEEAASILNGLDLPIADKVTILKGAFADAKASAIDAAAGVNTITAASAGATAGITGIGTAIKAFVGAHPFLTAAAAISAVIAGIATYRKHVAEVREEEREAAQAAADAWIEQQETLESQMERVSELRESIDSGDLSDQEIYDAKLSILEIQEEIVSQYGAQAEGVDLVNGNLEKQMSILQNITKENAKAVKAQNLQAFKDAREILYGSFNRATGGTVNDYKIGDLNNSSYAWDVSVKNLLKSFEGRGIKLGEARDGFDIPVYFTGNTEEAYSVFEDLMVGLADIQEEYGFDKEGSNNLIEGIVKGVNEAYESAVTLYEPNKKLVDAEAEIDAFIDEQLYSPTTGSGSKKGTSTKESSKKVYEWAKDYREAITELNKAFTTGEGVDEALSNFNELDSQISNMFGGTEYASKFEGYRKKLNEAALATYNFKKELSTDTPSKSKDFLPKTTEEVKDFKAEIDGLRETSKNNLIPTPSVINDKTVSQASNAKKSIHELSDELKALKLTDLDLKDMYVTSGLSDGEYAFNALVDAAKEYGIVSGDTVEDIQPLIDILIEEGVVTEHVSEQIETSVEEISTAYDDAVTGSKNALAEINNAMTLLTSGTTGKSVDVSLFDSAEMMGYASALEYVNGSIQVNQEKVRELAEAQADVKIQANDAAKALKIEEFKKNSDEISNLSAKLRELKEAGKESSEEYQNLFKQRTDLRSNNEDIIRQCNQLDLYTQSLREATGAYQQWLNSQNAGSEGDMARNVEAAMKNITDAFDPESSSYQRFGSTAYESAEEWLIPRNISNKGREAVDNYVKELGTYFGDRAGSEKFLNQAIDKGLMDYDPDTGAIQAVAGKTYKDFAQAFNWKESVVQAMFGEIEEFFPELDFTYLDNDGLLDSLATDAQTAATNLSKLAGLEDIELNLDVSGLETTEEQVASLESTISQLQEERATLSVDSSEYQDANTVIEYCVAKKQELEKPAIMHLNVDQSGVDAELQNALSLLQQFQNAQNTLEMQAAVGADTGEAQGQVDSLVSQIESLSPEIKAQVGLSEDVSADTIKAAIGELTFEGMVKMGVDRNAIDKEAWDKDGIVTYTADRSSVDAEEWDKDGTVTYTADVAALGRDLAPWLNKTGTINYTVNVSGLPSGLSGGGGGVGSPIMNGTHGLNGTAHASGNWGNKHPGWALTGELGQELVVIDLPLYMVTYK